MREKTAEPGSNASAPADALILLHPDDNVLVTTRSLPEGTEIILDGQSLVLRGALPVGHKLARRALATGEKIFKYGVPIGSLLASVARGEWVHMHNMTSDYLASHTRQSGNQATSSSQEPHS